MENYCESCGVEINYKRNVCEKCAKSKNNKKFIGTPEINAKILSSVNSLRKKFEKINSELKSELENLASIWNKRRINDDGEKLLNQKLSKITSFKMNILDLWETFENDITDSSIVDEEHLLKNLRK